METETYWKCEQSVVYPEERVLTAAAKQKQRKNRNRKSILRWPNYGNNFGSRWITNLSLNPVNVAGDVSTSEIMKPSAPSKMGWSLRSKLITVSTEFILPVPIGHASLNGSSAEDQFQCIAAHFFPVCSSSGGDCVWWLVGFWEHLRIITNNRLSSIDPPE